jgi:hypothetical protein
MIASRSMRMEPRTASSASVLWGGRRSIMDTRDDDSML